MVDHPATHLNLAVVRGRLSSDPVPRALPSGDVLLTYSIRVSRPAAPPASVRVVRRGGPPPAGLTSGDEVVVVGRVRRRFFRAGGATSSRTEIVADRVVPARRRAAVHRALEHAAGALAGSTGSS